MEGTSVTTITSPAHPSWRLILRLWAIGAFALSWVFWAVNGSFYGRLGVPVGGWPAWTMLDALLGPSALVAWALVGALWHWWARRWQVLAVALVGGVVLTGGSAMWVRHEADRARGGTPIRPSVAQPFDFSATAVTLLPMRGSLPAGLSPTVLLLRQEADGFRVYDPSRHQSVLVDWRVATWSISYGTG